jgi:transcriptional regulator with XRE-family HTH domain
MGIMASAGIIIKLLRITEGLSQTVLANKLGISRAYLSQVEKGRKQPGLNFLKEASRFFNIPIALLLLDENGDDPKVFGELRKILNDVLTVRIEAAHKKAKVSEIKN